MVENFETSHVTTHFADLFMLIKKNIQSILNDTVLSYGKLNFLIAFFIFYLFIFLTVTIFSEHYITLFTTVTTSAIY